MRKLTPARVRALLYQYPDLIAEYHVSFRGSLGGERVQSGPGRPTESEALRLAEVSQQIRFIERMLEPLEKEDRELIRLRYFEQLSWTAVAKALGISSSTAWERDQKIIEGIVARMEDDPAMF